MKRTWLIASIFVGVAAASISSATAGPQIEIVVGKEAPKITRFAAAEMSGQLKTLFDAEVSIRESASPDAQHVILLGEPQSNPELAKAIGTDWTKLSDQGIL